MNKMEGKKAIANSVPYKVVHKHSLDLVDHPGRGYYAMSTTRIGHTPGLEVPDQFSEPAPLAAKSIEKTITQSFPKRNYMYGRFAAFSVKASFAKNKKKVFLEKTTSSVTRLQGKARVIPLSQTLHTLNDCKTEVVVDSSEDNSIVPKVHTQSIKSILTARAKCPTSLFNTDSSDPVSVEVQPESKQLHTIMQNYYHHPFRNLSNKSKPKIWCQCGKDSILPCCKQAAAWIRCVFRRKGQRFDYVDSKKIYEELVEVKMRNSREQIEQIRRDLNRTFPSCPYFLVDGLFHMQRVLTAYSNYDQEIGYVQGMNFIVGSLLYHSSEEIAFWLFVSLIEDYNLREVFLNGLPGLFVHSKKIKKLMSKHLPDISSALHKFNISTEMFAPNWVITLFSSVIPIEEMSFFYNEFFENSWDSFYKVLLHLLRLHEKDVISAEDTAEAISLIKNSKPREQFSSFPLLNRITIEVNWKTLILNSRSEKL